MPKQKPYNKHFIEVTFHVTTSKPLNTGNPGKSTKTVPDDTKQN